MAGETVTATVHIDAPPERVYEYFTRPEAIVRWMGDYAVLEPEPGGQFTVDVKGAPVRGRFLHLDPPHCLLISWGYAGSDRLPPGTSTLQVRFTAEGSGTRVILEHRDLPPAERAGHASAGCRTTLRPRRRPPAGVRPAPVRAATPWNAGSPAQTHPRRRHRHDKLVGRRQATLHIAMT